ncbi:MAG: hypothetical protein WBQ55_12785 [Xanthobacteraceae bacterium]
MIEAFSRGEIDRLKTTGHSAGVAGMNQHMMAADNPVHDEPGAPQRGKRLSCIDGR